MPTPALLCASFLAAWPFPTPDKDATLTVVCEAEGLSRVVRAMPSGARVKAGDRICELDPTEARANVEAAARQVEAARRAVRSASLERESATLALEERIALTEIERSEAQARASVAEAALGLAEARLADARAARPPVATAVRLAIEERDDATADLAAARREALELEIVRGPSLLKAARIDLEIAEDEEDDRRNGLEAAEALAATARKSLESRTIIAPVAGTLVHVRWRPTGDERGYARVEPGAYVGEGQALFRIDPDAHGADRPGD